MHLLLTGGGRLSLSVLNLVPWSSSSVVRFHWPEFVEPFPHSHIFILQVFRAWHRETQYILVIKWIFLHCFYFARSKSPMLPSRSSHPHTSVMRNQPVLDHRLKHWGRGWREDGVAHKTAPTFRRKNFCQESSKWSHLLVPAGGWTYWRSTPTSDTTLISMGAKVEKKQVLLPPLEWETTRNLKKERKAQTQNPHTT